MSMAQLSYRRHRFPVSNIQHAIWLHLLTVPAWQGRASVVRQSIGCSYLYQFEGDSRPLFAGAERHSGLWASTKGRPLTAVAIAQVITDRTRKAFGQSVSLSARTSSGTALQRPSQSSSLAASGSREICLAMPRSPPLMHSTIRLALSKRAGFTLECLLNLAACRQYRSMSEIGVLPPSGIRPV